jgi:hypothetical protein
MDRALCLCLLYEDISKYKDINERYKEKLSPVKTINKKNKALLY